MGAAPNMFGMPTDPMTQAMMASAMQNPAHRQMVMQMMQNPQFMQQVLSSHPLFQSMSNEQRAAIAQQLSNPATIEQMFNMMSGPGFAPPNAPPSTGAAAPQAPPNFNFFAPPPTQVAPPVSTEDLRARYSTQLEQLRSMGFPNEAANLVALRDANGSVDFAVDRLLNTHL